MQAFIQNSWIGGGGGVGHSKGGVFVYLPMGVFGNGGVVVQMGGGG